MRSKKQPTNTTISLSKNIATQANTHRALVKHVEYWDRMRKIAQENPELPLHFLKYIILGQSEYEKQQLEPYNWEQEQWIY